MEGKEFWIRTVALLSVLGDSYCLPRQEKCRCECCNRCLYNFSRGWKLALSSLGTFDINCHCCTAEVWCLIMLDKRAVIALCSPGQAPSKSRFHLRLIAAVTVHASKDPATLDQGFEYLSALIPGFESPLCMQNIIDSDSRKSLPSRICTDNQVEISY